MPLVAGRLVCHFFRPHLSFGREIFLSKCLNPTFSRLRLNLKHLYISVWQNDEKNDGSESEIFLIKKLIKVYDKVNQFFKNQKETVKYIPPLCEKKKFYCFPAIF